MEFFLFLIYFKVILLGAVYGRLDGGGIAKTSEWIERSLVMFFFVLACAPFAGYWALFAYAGVLGIMVGHGTYLPEGKVKSVSPESVDFLVSPLFGEDPRFNTDNYPMVSILIKINKYGKTKLYWRNAYGMFITGTLVGIPAAILSIIYGQYIPALLFSLTGVIKSISYMVGWKLFKNTESAEYINGGLRNLICVAAIKVLLFQ